MKISAITSKIGDRVKPTLETMEEDRVLQRLIGSEPMEAEVLSATEDGHPFPIVVQFTDGTLYAFEEYQVEKVE